MTRYGPEVVTSSTGSPGTGGVLWAHPAGQVEGGVRGLAATRRGRGGGATPSASAGIYSRRRATPGRAFDAAAAPVATSVVSTAGRTPLRCVDS